MEKSKPGKLNVVFESAIAQPMEQDESASTEDQSSERSSGDKGSFKQYFAIASIPMVLVFGNSMLVPVLPELQRALGISQFQSSLVITLFSLAAGIVIPFAGYLSDRFSRKAVIIPALIVYGAAGILAGFGAIWGSYSVVIWARALQGIGGAGTAPIAMALVGDLYSGGTQSKVLGLTEAANGTGKVLSPILGSLLALITWYTVFFAFPVFCLISLVAVWAWIKEPEKSKEAPRIGAYLAEIGGILKEKARWLVTSFFAGSLALFILFGVLFYLSNILEEPPYSIAGVPKGLILAIPLLCMVITSYTTGSLIKKNGVVMRWLMNIGLFMLTISLALSIFFYDHIYVLIGLLTFGSIGTGLLLPCLNSIITGSVESSERGMITSMYNSLRFLGVAFGPPLFGWLMAKSDMIVFITVSCLSFITLVLVFLLIKPDAEVS